VPEVNKPVVREQQKPAPEEVAREAREVAKQPAREEAPVVKKGEPPAPAKAEKPAPPPAGPLPAASVADLLAHPWWKGKATEEHIAEIVELITSHQRGFVFFNDKGEATWTERGPGGTTLSDRKPLLEIHLLAEKGSL